MKKNWNPRRPLFSSPSQVKPRRAKRKWVILPVLWAAAKRTCMALGVLVLISAIYGILIASQFSQPQAKPLPQKMVLYIDFEGGISEIPEPASFADPFAAGPPTLREMVAAIDRAAADERVQGVYARMGSGSFALAHVQELRDALKRFKEAGKFTYIYAESYGDAAGGFGGYYLASAFDQLWLQPMGIVSITGMALQMPYVRPALDKLGVTPEFFQRKEYKTAYESLMEEGMTSQNREMMTALLNDLKGSFMADIPAERGLTPDQFTRDVNHGLFTAKAALKAGLVTKVDYADVLVDDVLEQVTGDREYQGEVFVGLPHYLADMRRKRNEETLLAEFAPKKPKVALIYAVGMIMPDAAGGQVKGIAAADKIAGAISAAGDDPTIDAIVLRVDSPGGSPTASETILRAIEKAKENNKMIVVSMGATAASGGYWISAYADQIFVMPTTLTGSIGVVGGKFSVGGLFEKLGIRWEGIQWGENADLWALNKTYDDSEAARVNEMLDQVYDGFVARVARGRKMTPEQVERVARGRVWSGARAVEIGLADDLGGLTEALNYTAQTLGKESKNDISIILIPKPKTPLERILDMLANSGYVFENLRVSSALMQMIAPAADELSAMQNPGLYGVYEPLRLR